MPSDAELRVRKSERPLNEAASFIAGKTAAAVDHISTAVDRSVERASGAIESAQKQGGAAADSAGEVFGNIRHAIDKSARSQPTATVLLAVGFGFLLGAMWARGK